METVTIEKLVHGGQGLGTLADGRKIFVWNALPGETVEVRVIKKKRSYLEGIAELIENPSPERVEPSEANYLATSPWQMMAFAAENRYKGTIVTDLFQHEKVVLPAVPPVIYTEAAWNYRNKMEYSFWGDDDGLHLALHRRGSHGKEIVSGSRLALPAVDAGADAVLQLLRQLDVRAGDLKTVIVRANQAGETVAALFVKPLDFPQVSLPAGLKGLRVYHSNPKSPASVATALLYELGSCVLSDSLLGRPFYYDVDSFFQANIPVFEQALQSIKQALPAESITDMYAGVGSIGLSVAHKAVDLIELDVASAAMANVNVADSGLEVRVVQASTEKVLDYITASQPVIFDPPRAGLHDKVVERVLAVRPEQIVYLSCNPATHARDLAKLQEAYTIEKFEIYNFFPQTPHIETLAVLHRT